MSNVPISHLNAPSVVEKAQVARSYPLVIVIVDRARLYNLGADPERKRKGEERSSTGTVNSFHEAI